MSSDRSSQDVDVSAFLRAWAGGAPFGPLDEWPLALKTLLPLVLRNPLPALLFWGPQLRVVYNDACQPWLGSKHPGAIGAEAAEVWADVWETLGPTIERVVTTGEGACIPVALPSSDSLLVAPSVLGLACTPAFDERGRIAGVLLSPANPPAHPSSYAGRSPRASLTLAELELRERLLAERELLLNSELAARAEAEAANRAKDEFLAMLGHELRNPLSPILTALGLMRLRGERSREHAVIERQVGHLVRLVDDLLDVSRITRGKIELRLAPVELSSVVRRAVEIASPLLERRNQRLEMAVPETGLVVDADADRLAQVVANLLTNAAKYSPVGAYIWISAQPLDSQVWLRVRDEGIGITREMLEAVFTAFVQQPQSLDRASGGLGLGLAIVQSLVRMHGGQVEARSAGPGKGSEFVVSLPLSAAAIRESHPPPPAAGPSKSSPVEPTRILVVDDNEDAADLLADALARVGYKTRVANDGPSALELAESFRPSIALLDIGLPVMDGYELAHRLRGFACPPRLIAVTGYGQPTDRSRSERAGFSAHLVKPVSIEQLIDAVRAIEAGPLGGAEGGASETASG